MNAVALRTGEGSSTCRRIYTGALSSMNQFSRSVRRFDLYLRCGSTSAKREDTHSPFQSNSSNSPVRHDATGLQSDSAPSVSHTFTFQ